MTLLAERRQIVTGLDGKQYYNQPMSQTERDHVIGRTHYLSHDEDLSVRQIQDYWLYNHGLRRSVGTISAYLSQPCIKCSGDQKESPEQHPQNGRRSHLGASVNKETHPSLAGSRVGP